MAYQPFPSTHWSLVGRAGKAVDSSAQREALTTLLKRYEPALRSYLEVVRRLRKHEADDILQAFITDRILESQILKHADQSRGKFRTFLLTALHHFIIDHHRQKVTQKRGGAAITGDGLPDIQATPDVTAADPQHTFDIAWARETLRNTLAEMRRECLANGREDVWQVFQTRVVDPILENAPEAPRDLLVTEMGLVDERQASNLLVTGKRMFARLLRQAVAEYEADESAIDDELRTLRSILASTGGV